MLNVRPKFFQGTSKVHPKSIQSRSKVCSKSVRSLSKIRQKPVASLSSKARRSMSIVRRRSSRACGHHTPATPTHLLLGEVLHAAPHLEAEAQQVAVAERLDGAVLRQRPLVGGRVVASEAAALARTLRLQEVAQVAVRRVLHQHEERTWGGSEVKVTARSWSNDRRPASLSCNSRSSGNF